MIARALPLVALVAACDAPYGPCRPGDSRDPGPGCTAPSLANVAIDGDPAEWDAANLVSIPACDPTLACDLVTACGDTDPLRGCCPGFVSALQFAIDGDSVVFHVSTVDATKTDHVLYVQSLVFEEAADTLAILVDSTDHVALELNQLEIAGFPITAATRDRSIEVRVPTDVLPFRAAGADMIAPAQCHPRGDQRAHVCWDATQRDACGTY